MNYNTRHKMEVRRLTKEYQKKQEKKMNQTIQEETKIKVALEKIEEHLRTGALSFCNIDDMISQNVEEGFYSDTVAGEVGVIMVDEEELYKEWVNPQ